MFQVLTWLLTVITIIGTFLNAKQYKSGFVVWGVCNLIWCLIDFSRGVYAQSFLYIVFIGFNIYGFLQWREKNK